jgi:hypothetical protein
LTPDEFSAPPAAPDAFPGQAAGGGQTAAAAGFLGRAVGSIHESKDFWKKTFEYDPYVWRILEEGYKIPVKMTAEEKATRYREKNNKSARDNIDFVRQEVNRLVKSGQVIKVKEAPQILNPLSVAYKINADGTYKARLVTDLSRWVNKFVIPDRYRMARLQDALAQSSKGDYQNVFDITKAYHHIRLHPESYDLVGFCVESPEGVEEFYHYVVLVFGLGPAGQALGRVKRPVLSFLSLEGVCSTMYVDDGRTLAGSKEKGDKDYKLTLDTFLKAGFTIAEDKSDKVGSAAQVKEYLGFAIDTNSMSVHVPKPNLDRIKAILKGFLGSRLHKVREVASVIGKLISLETALGKAVLVGTRLATIAVVSVTDMADSAKRRQNPWEQSLTLSLEARASLSEVLDRLDEWNGFPIRCQHMGITLFQ